jgi:hypothetical protein
LEFLGLDYMPPPAPGNEEERMRILRALGILDTDREGRFDNITQLLCAVFNVPIAAVSLVDADKSLSCVRWLSSSSPHSHSFVPCVSFSCCTAPVVQGNRQVLFSFMRAALAGVVSPTRLHRHFACVYRCRGTWRRVPNRARRIILWVDHPAPRPQSHDRGRCAEGRPVFRQSVGGWPTVHQVLCRGAAHQFSQ